MVSLLTFLWLEFTQMDGLFKSIYPFIVGLVVSGSHYIFSEAGGRWICRKNRDFRVTVGKFWAISLAGALFGFLMVYFNAQCPGMEKIYPDIFYFYTDHPDPPSRISIFYKLIFPPWLVSTFLMIQGELKQQLKKDLALIRQINRALEKKTDQDGQAGLVPDGENGTAFFNIRSENRRIRIAHKDLISVSVKDHYCELVYFRGEEVCRDMVRLSLKEAVKQLPKSIFEQVHRSHVVNRGHVIQVARKGQAFQLKMAGHANTIPASRHRSRDFLPRIRAGLN